MLWGVSFPDLSVSCSVCFLYLYNLGMFSSITLLKVWSMPLTWDSSLYSMPTIHRFGLLMVSHSSWILYTQAFLIFLIFYLDIKFFNFIFEYLLSVFCLFHSPLKTPQTLLIGLLNFLIPSSLHLSRSLVPWLKWMIRNQCRKNITRKTYTGIMKIRLCQLLGK